MLARFGSSFNGQVASEHFYIVLKKEQGDRSAASRYHLSICPPTLSRARVATGGCTQGDGAWSPVAVGRPVAQPQRAAHSNDPVLSKQKIKRIPFFTQGS